MEWTALQVSLWLAAATTALLLPAALWLARALAWGRWRGRWLAESAVALPLVLPPTVLGYYLLVALGRGSPIGDWYRALAGHTLAFSFEGLVVASFIVNLPFAVQPMQRAFEAIPESLREAAWVCGHGRWRTFLMVELPLALPGIFTAAVLVFMHTIGEFGVVLMVGGNIEGETRTISIAIFDQAQALDHGAAGAMSALLAGAALLAVAAVNGLARRHRAGARPRRGAGA